MRREIFSASVALVVALGVAYLPDLGHGFIKDDFAWIFHGRIRTIDDFGRIALSSVGFYRPVVTLSFGINEWLFGTWSFGYGLTNFLLLLSCAVAIFVAARQLELSSWAALFAAAVWAFNFHGINMAVLWLSGRTALLLTLFATATLIAVRRERRWASFAFAMLALCSKEEAVVLPLICAVWAPRRPAAAAVPAAIALGVYLALRAGSEAFTPFTAPDYYRFKFEVVHVITNLKEYFDRSAALAIGAVLLLTLYLRQQRLAIERKDVIVKGLSVATLGFALTMWLPVRSSLYAVWPSVGIAIAVAAVAEAAMKEAEPIQLRRAAFAAVLLPFLLIPIYWARNVRWAELALLSSRTIHAIEVEAAAVPGGTAVIELVDDPTTRASFANTFGTLLAEAGEVHFDNRLRLWVEPPSAEMKTAGMRRPEGESTVVLRLHEGQIVRQ